jgi:predicted small secreted protein
MSKMKTTTKILELLATIVPTADYLAACNAARGIGETRERLEQRLKFITRLTEDLAYEVDTLAEKVEDALTMESEVKSLLDFRALDHGHLITERFPVDDEHSNAA